MILQVQFTHRPCDDRYDPVVLLIIRACGSPSHNQKYGIRKCDEHVNALHDDHTSALRRRSHCCPALMQPRLLFSCSHSCETSFTFLGGGDRAVARTPDTYTRAPMKYHPFAFSKVSCATRFAQAGVVNHQLQSQTLGLLLLVLLLLLFVNLQDVWDLRGRVLSNQNSYQNSYV